MATINSLTTSISDLSVDSCLSLIAQIRNNRKTRPVRKKKSTAKKKKPTISNPLDLISSMSSEEKLALAELLKGK